MQLTPTYRTYWNPYVFTKTATPQYTDSFKVKLIIDVLCTYSGYKRGLLLSEAKFRELAELRQIGMAIAKTNTKLSLKSVSTKFKRDCHTTCVHALKNVSDFCATEKVFKQKVKDIETMIEKYFVLTHKF